MMDRGGYFEVIKEQKQEIDKLIRLGRMERIIGCRVVNDDGTNIFYCGATRPWTSSCVSNLYQNMINNWSAADSAKETNRDIQEIIFMMAFIKLHGYEKVYMDLLRKELNFDVSKEIRFLQKLGITS